MRNAPIRSICAAVVFAMLAGASLYANHSWNGYHWARTRNPFTLKTGDNVSQRWDAFLDVAISDWSKSGVLDLQKVAGQANPKNCRPTSGRIEVCNSRYGNTGWLGIAQIWVTGGTHITQGVTKLNDYYFDMPKYDTDAWRQLVTCQEVAHDFGLDHQDETFNNPNLGTCMDYTNDPDGGGSYGASNEHPNQHDYDEIDEIYSHLDTTTTVGALLPQGAPAAISDLSLDGPGQWGRLVSTTRNGRGQTYELDFGRGNKIITHVFWADTERGRQ